MSSTLTPAEVHRYSRHTIIPEIGLAGQHKLKAASVLIIGTGGLGSPAAMYLAAAGVGIIGLVDNDVVDESNLQRQVIHGSGTIGRPKVESAHTRLLDLNPHINIIPHAQSFTEANALDLARPYDVIVDCSDNLPTRYLSNQTCIQLGKPNVYGSVARFEGQASVFDAAQGPCYRCAFPTPPAPGVIPSGAETGVLGAVPGVIGTIQAAEAIKLILGIGQPLIGRLLILDAQSMTFEEIHLKKNPHCPACAPQK